MGVQCLMGTELQFGTMETFWRWMVEMAAQEFELNATELHFKMDEMANFVLSIFYLDF